MISLYYSVEFILSLQIKQKLFHISIRFNCSLSDFKISGLCNEELTNFHQNQYSTNTAGNSLCFQFYKEKHVIFGLAFIINFTLSGIIFTYDIFFSAFLKKLLST